MFLSFFVTFSVQVSRFFFYPKKFGCFELEQFDDSNFVDTNVPHVSDECNDDVAAKACWRLDVGLYISYIYNSQCFNLFVLIFSILFFC